AVAEIPEPMPVVMDQVAVVRLFRGRPEPDVEIEVGRRLRVLLLADAPSRLAAVALRDEQLAVLAGLHRRDLARPARAAPLLRAVLDDPLVLLCRLDHFPTLGDQMGHRLLDVRVLAGLAGPDTDERVPVVRGGDGDRVQLLVVEGLADVGDALRGNAVLLLDR